MSSATRWYRRGAEAGLGPPCGVGWLKVARIEGRVMRTLVFGGTGLIGTQVINDLLAGGVEVVVASRHPPISARPAVSWIACDVSKREAVSQLFREVRPSKVVHLAAALQFACERDPAVAVRVNVAGTLNVLESARDHGAERVVFGSSVAVYGENGHKLHEETPPSPSVSLYGCAKRLEEELGIRFAPAFGLRFIALRYCGVFGPGKPQTPGMALVRKQIEATRTGTPVSIGEAGGEERIQFTYVKDASAATLMALKHPDPRHSIYNVAGAEENHISLREYHRAIRTLFPGAGDVHFSGRARDVGPLDIGRICRDLGFKPRYSVLDGLREMYAKRELCAG